MQSPTFACRFGTASPCRRHCDLRLSATYGPTSSVPVRPHRRNGPRTDGRVIGRRQRSFSAQRTSIGHPQGGPDTPISRGASAPAGCRFHASARDDGSGPCVLHFRRRTTARTRPVLDRSRQAVCGSLDFTGEQTQSRCYRRDRGDRRSAGRALLRAVRRDRLRTGRRETHGWWAGPGRTG